MEITDIEVQLNDGIHPAQRVLAFCNIVVDHGLAVRNIRVINGTNNTYLSMPSRPIEDPCPICQHYNKLTAKFCNNCGFKLDPQRVGRFADGEPKVKPDGERKLHEDLVHPIVRALRISIESQVLAEYRRVRASGKSTSKSHRRLYG